MHLGPGPRVDDEHLTSLRAALLDGGEVELTEPGESEDFGRRWESVAALTEFGEREPTEPWTWAGPAKTVTGRTWGGCVEVIAQLALADRMPSNEDLAGGILMLETSVRLTPAEVVEEQLRAYGERGLLGTVAGVVVARPPVSSFDVMPSAAERASLRAAQRDAVIEQVGRYNPDAVACVGVPFGHTRPPWIVPYSGEIAMPTGYPGEFRVTSPIVIPSAGSRELSRAAPVRAARAPSIRPTAAWCAPPPRA